MPYVYPLCLILFALTAVAIVLCDACVRFKNSHTRYLTVITYLSACDFLWGSHDD